MVMLFELLLLLISFAFCCYLLQSTDSTSTRYTRSIVSFFFFGLAESNISMLVRVCVFRQSVFKRLS